MRKYAVLQENVVVEISDMEDSQCQERSRLETIIDIEDQAPQPEIGWVFSQNKIVPTEPVSDPDQLDAIQQKSQRLFGLKLLPRAVDMVGARNLKLAREGTPANVASLATQMQTVKLLLEGGALKTTRTVCTALKPSFPEHSDILQFVMDEINNFLAEHGWD